MFETRTEPKTTGQIQKPEKPYLVSAMRIVNMIKCLRRCYTSMKLGYRRIKEKTLPRAFAIVKNVSECY